MLRLHQREGAGRPLRVRWALEEAGAAYEYEVMSREAAGTRGHERHPLGRVPVLETDEGFLFESAALCLHIADLHPEAGLIAATGTQERAEIYQWAFFAMTELEPALIRAYLGRRRDDAEEAAKADAHYATVAGVVAAALDGHDHLVGDRFTISDVVMGGVIESARRYELMPEPAVLHERDYAERQRANSEAAKRKRPAGHVRRNPSNHHKRACPGKQREEDRAQKKRSRAGSRLRSRFGSDQSRDGSRGRGISRRGGTHSSTLGPTPDERERIQDISPASPATSAARRRS